MESPTQSLALFTLRDGLVSSSAAQGLVDAFAADFQGLKHFGAKLGDSLGLGEPWMGTLQEQDFTMNFAYFDGGTGSLDPGAGALIGEKRPLYELLTRVNEAAP
ncbi:MAG: hypothetical protein IPK32_17895 [Verrucomicrobiaceae bacterium]|nr:hypothetical protein [Verrucomicrobiaceae bacterium]